MGILIDFLLKAAEEGVKKFGPQHNTHISNAASKPVKAVIKHGGGVETRVVEPRETINFPTPHGNIEVYVIPYKNNRFGVEADARAVDKSDRSFIVKEASTGDLNLVRAKYGTLWQEEK